MICCFQLFLKMSFAKLVASNVIYVKFCFIRFHIICFDEGFQLFKWFFLKEFSWDKHEWVSNELRKERKDMLRSKMFWWGFAMSLSCKCWVMLINVLIETFELCWLNVLFELFKLEKLEILKWWVNFWVEHVENIKLIKFE